MCFKMPKTFFTKRKIKVKIFMNVLCRACDKLVNRKQLKYLMKLMRYIFVESI